MVCNADENREHLHTRSIEARGYRRSDGGFDIEVNLRDTKTYDRMDSVSPRLAGMPIHDMSLRITVDTTMTIVDAQAIYDAVPYRGACDSISDAYRQLVGLRLAPGLNIKVRELFGGTRGCTHMTDLIAIAATTAFQTIGGRAANLPEGSPPFQLDRCHALKVSGPVVARHYAQWSTARAEKAGNEGES